MKKITLLCAILLLLAQLTFSQNIIAKRVKISNPTRAELIKIKETGIDLTCGALYIDNNVILEIGEYELNALTEKGISYTVLVDDLMEEAKRRSETELPLAKAQLKEMKAKTKARKSLSTKSTSINNFIQYEGESEVDWAVPQNFNLGSMLGCLTYNEVLAELDQMRALYPNLISVKTDASPGAVTHGNSYTNNGVYDKWEGQPIYYVRISDNPDTDESNEPESLYSGMTHSREVSSMMNLIYYMWYILENYDSDPGIKNLVDNHEMYFIPVANPDGLMWNEQTSPNGNGLQRKNLGPYNTGDHQSRGVDLNRNYNYFWGGHDDYAKGTTGSSPNSPDQTYRGPSAFSEPETQIVRNFSATREFKTAMNHHASSNLIPHAYNGYPDSPGSGREAEYHKFCHDMTRYNRYIYGEAPDILTIANGDMSDWMLGGATDLNGSNGSGQGILALAPENGSWVGSDNEGGFWPSATKIVEIAQRAVRMNLVNAYHSGKFAQFHDLNPSNIAATSGNLEFGLEYLGQTLGDITLNVTPVSSNITSITPPATQSGWSKLEQRTVTAAYTLDAGIQPNDKIEFQISVTNDDGYLMYRANIVKYFNPTILTQDNPDVTGISKWTSSGGAWGTINTTDVFNNSTAAITDSPSGSYSNNQNKTLTYNTSVDLSTSSSAVVQFYAKWDLERNFDYVQIQGSTNGSTWIPLNGKYTKPGSSISTNRYSSANSSNNGTGKSTADQNNQPTGESIYDADTMDKWVMEEILIDATENSALFGASNVQFRFLLNSDNSNRADGYPTNFDGFTFDDFKVISFNDNLPQAITFEPISDKLTISSDFNVSATSNSGLSITYTILSGPATISGNTISLNGTEGTVVVEASQTGNATYNPAESVTRSFEITETYCGEAIVNTFPFNEGFESYFTLWLENSSDDDINWTRKLKENDGDSTPSGGTGPSTSSEGDYFIFTEASGNGTGFPNKEAILESPCFDFSGYENAQLEFDFHMFGADMGKLSLEVSTNNGASYISLFSRDKTTNGNQTANASAWITETIDLSTYDGETIKFRFIGLTGANFTSDMAIDNINITADVVSGFTPVASCQNINATLDGTGNVTITASDLNDGSSVGDLSIDISTFTCANLGTNNVTLTATDPSDSGNTNSCVAVVTVTANKPADDVTNETICSGESYTWSANSTTYTTSQSGLTITNDGCTADQVLNLTVTPKPADDVTNATICSGESYTWSANSTTYTTSQSGLTITNDGCTADQVLNLTVTPKPADDVTNETICSGESYTWSANSTTYTTSQSGLTITNNGCTADQVLNLTVTPKPADDVTNATICSGESYTWSANGTTYTTSQSGLTITNNGCTADQVLNLTVTPKPTDDVTNETICSGESYTWSANSTTYTTSQSGLTITNDGCTADQVLNLTITPKPADDVTDATICSGESYTWSANGTTYTTSQSGLTITNDGCTADQVLNLTVTPKPADDVTDATICSGESYIWSANGTTYTTSQSGLTITNDGCTADQVLNLTVTPKPADDVTDATICSGESYTWSANGTTYTTSQSGLTITNDGCTADQVLNLTVTPKPADDVTDATICSGESYTWSANGTTYTTSQSGLTITNDGCTADQVLNLTVTPKPADDVTDATICSGESYTWSANGTTYTTSQSGLTITNDGCTADQVLNLTVTPKPADDVTDATICSGESYTWSANGTTYTTSQSGLTITNDGCTADQVLNLTITPKPADDVTDATICSGESYTWSANGTTYTTSQSGLTITNDGCTADQVLNLTVTPKPADDVTDATICSGESYTWSANGTTYTTSQSGLTITNDGCTADQVLNLTVTPKPADDVTDATICSGESYTWSANGTTYTTSQSGLTIINDGCTADQVLNLTVTPKPADDVTDATICSGESYTWSANGTTYTTSQSGLTITNDGCTADQVLNLTVTPKPADDVTNETICSGESYTWSANGTTYTTSQSGLTITNDGCTADQVLNLTVTPKPADDVTDATICSGESYTWSANGTTYTTSQSGLTITNDGCTADQVLNLTVTPATTWYLDADNDNYADSSITACSSPGVGYTTTVMPTTDCDDTDNTIYPGAPEVTNDGIDQDCDGSDQTTLDNSTQEINLIAVTPNPFKDNVNIQLPSSLNNSDFNIKVFDLNGRLVYDRKFSSKNGQVKVVGLSKLDQALYVFKIADLNSGETIYKRLIKY